MRIHTREMHPELELPINGDEPWLARIYSDFPAPAGRDTPKISGHLTLRHEEAGTVTVHGHLTYAPFVACGRCEQPIAWPLDLPIDVRYTPEYAHDESIKEKTLSRAELDEYFLDKSEVDLEELINDTIQTNLPSRPVAVSEDGHTCGICQAGIDGDLVYGPGMPKAESPFAKLLKDASTGRNPRKNPKN